MVQVLDFRAIDGSFYNSFITFSFYRMLLSNQQQAFKGYNNDKTCVAEPQV